MLVKIMSPKIHKPAEKKESRGNKRGFSVSASPFNGVKLELGIIFILGALLWLGAHSIIASTGAQLLIFFGFGLLSALWLVARTRVVLHQHEACEVTEQNGLKCEKMS